MRNGPANGPAAPAAVGGVEQESSNAGPGAKTRRSAQRSAGRMGVEQRSDRADERAAGPDPDKPVDTVDERAAGRGDPPRGATVQDTTTPSEREARLRGSTVEKIARPVPTPRAAPAGPRPHNPPTPEPAPAAEPEPVATAIATVTPVPTGPAGDTSGDAGEQ
jgi:hypothetical protein